MDELKSTDLRIGNLIYAVHEESESVVKVDAWWLNAQVEYEENPYADQFSRGWWFSPIELSSDILLKAGFKKHSDVIYNHGETMAYLGNGFVDYYSWGHPIKKEIKTLHELQNLYFALTGTELHINI